MTLNYEFAGNKYVFEYDPKAIKEKDSTIERQDEKTGYLFTQSVWFSELAKGFNCSVFVNIDGLNVKIQSNLTNN